LVTDAELREIAEEAEYLQKPEDHGNYNNAIENSFDLPLHGDKAVDEPHHNADYDQLASLNVMRFPWFVSFSNAETSVPGMQAAERIGPDGAASAQEP
jgi:hypothetical protein